MSTTLDEIIKMLQALELKIDRILAAQLGIHSVPSGKDPLQYDAEDKSVDFRTDPKDWKGPSYIGVHPGKCPAEYLKSQIRRSQWSIKKEKEKPEDEQKKSKTGTPYWKYNERDLAKVIYWLEKVEAGSAPGPQLSKGGVPLPAKKPVSSMSDEDYAASDEIPF